MSIYEGFDASQVPEPFGYRVDGEPVTDLLPCPFCGSVAIEIDLETDDPWWVLRCSGCGISRGDSIKDDLVTAWNTRKGPSHAE